MNNTPPLVAHPMHPARQPHIGPRIGFVQVRTSVAAIGVHLHPLPEANNLRADTPRPRAEVKQPPFIFAQISPPEAPGPPLAARCGTARGDSPPAGRIGLPALQGTAPCPTMPRWLGVRVGLMPARPAALAPGHRAAFSGRTAVGGAGLCQLLASAMAHRRLQRDGGRAGPCPADCAPPRPDPRPELSGRSFAGLRAGLARL